MLRLAALAALLGFLMLGEPPERTRFWMAFFDFGHAPLAGVAALLVRSLVRRPPAAVPGAVSGFLQRHASIVAFALTVALGAAVEGLQVLQVHRDASWQDLWRDAAGAVSFLLLFDAAAGGTHQRGWQQSRAGRWAAVLMAAALLAAAAVPLGRTIAVYLARNRAAPTLFALDGSWWERVLIEEGHSRLTPSRSPARLDLEPAGYPGITFNEPYPDWRGYRFLVLTIASDLDVPLTMAIRIHDATHNRRFEDRFNRRLTVEPGQNVYRIPVDEIRRAPRGREIDLRRIRGILIFAANLDRPAHVYLGPLRLER